MKSRLRQIFICVMVFILIGNNSFVLAATSGSSGNPYELKQGTAKSVTISKDETKWFEFKQRGVFKIKFTTEAKMNVVIYKKKIVGKEKLASFSVDGSKTKQYAVDSNTKYLISVKASKKAKATVKQYLVTESKSSENGGVWIPKSNSPNPDPNFYYFGVFYVPKGAVPSAYIVMENDKYLKVLDKAADMAENAALLYLTKNISIPAKYTKVMEKAAQLKILADIIDAYPEFSFANMYKNDIKEKSGLNTSTGKADNGVIIKVYLYNGIKHYTINSWEGSTMKGVPGWDGKFITFEEYNESRG